MDAGRRATATLLVGLALAVLGGGCAGGAAAAPTPSPTLPPAPECATAVAVAVGTTTSTPTPLPVPTSAVGGVRLSDPGLQADLAPGAPAPPRLRATAWLVADLDTGAVLASCNAHVPLAPASTLKVLTALALLPRVAMTVRYTARPQDAAVDGTKVGLSPGSQYTGADLWHGLLMSSGNDAATALASLVGGSGPASALMTATAQRLGADDTVVANTSGLDAPGQVTSVYDLALLGRAALADPTIARLVTTRTYVFPDKGTLGQPGRHSYQISNHNRLLFNYPGATGVKNGYTVAAGGSYIGSAARGGHRYLVTLLRGEGDTWHLARDLLDWAFVAGPSAAPVGTLDAFSPQPTGSATPSGPVTSTPAPPSGSSGPSGSVVTAAAGPAAPAGPTGRSGPGLSAALWVLTAATVLATGASVWSTVRRRRRLGRFPTRRRAVAGASPGRPPRRH